MIILSKAFIAPAPKSALASVFLVSAKELLHAADDEWQKTPVVGLISSSISPMFLRNAPAVRFLS